MRASPVAGAPARLPKAATNASAGFPPAPQPAEPSGGVVSRR